MRIIAGKYKGQRLSAPSGRTTRPSSDRLRETLFNILTHADWAPSLEGAYILDVFAGSGALGLEALSRGAEFGLFLETDRHAIACLKANIDMLGLEGQTRLYTRDAVKIGPMPAQYPAQCDLVFMDPPYHKGLVLPALERLEKGGWLAKDALIIIETAAEESIDLTPRDILNQRRIGAGQLHFTRPLTLST